MKCSNIDEFFSLDEVAFFLEPFKNKTVSVRNTNYVLLSSLNNVFVCSYYRHLRLYIFQISDLIRFFIESITFASFVFSHWDSKLLLHFLCALSCFLINIITFWKLQPKQNAYYIAIISMTKELQKFWSKFFLFLLKYAL